MVNVMVSSIVRCNVLQRIKWQRIATMIVDGFDCGASEKPHALTGAHPS